jgi:hypothetical protein
LEGTEAAIARKKQNFQQKMGKDRGLFFLTPSDAAKRLSIMS